MPRNTLCFEIEGGPTSAIRLTQQGRNRFAVQYGMQVEAGLPYGRAAAKLGEAIMHAAACDSKLDNRMPGER